MKKRVGNISGCPVSIRSYPTFVEVACGGRAWQFRSYDQAMHFVQRLTRTQGKERKQHDYRR